MAHKPSHYLKDRQEMASFVEGKRIKIMLE